MICCKSILFLGVVSSLIAACTAAQVSTNRMPAADPGLCAQQKAFLDNQKRISPRALAQGIHAQVILIGEDHDNNSHFYPEFLKMLTVDCVTFELGAVDIPASDYAFPQWQELATAATRLGVRTFKVDHCNPHPEDPSGFICLMGRNEAMGANIASLLRHRICRHILQVNGFQHLEHGLTGTGLPLPDRLARMGISVFKIRMVNTAADLRDGVVQANLREEDPWIWGGKDQKPVCSPPPAIVEENYAFMISGSAAKQIPLTLQATSDAWSNYGAALVIGLDPPSSAAPQDSAH